jgi:hypothetical protein
VRVVSTCEGCGFAYLLDQADGAGPAIVEGSAAIATLIETLPTDVARRRAHPHTWSPLEYGCHVRDVLLVQRERVLTARRTTTPAFEPMGRDERVEHDGYAEQAPAAVARQLVDAAQLFTNVLGRLGPSDWNRTVIYSYPRRTERSLRWVAVHTEHEVHHHLADIECQLR